MTYSRGPPFFSFFLTSFYSIVPFFTVFPPPNDIGGTPLGYCEFFFLLYTSLFSFINFQHLRYSNAFVSLFFSFYTEHAVYCVCELSLVVSILIYIGLLVLGTQMRCTTM
jgi:hypothetical protein